MSRSSNPMVNIPSIGKKLSPELPKSRDSITRGCPTIQNNALPNRKRSLVSLLTPAKSISATDTHSLALSARRPSHLDPSPLNAVLNEFLQSNFVQDTDIRLASLFRVAYGAHFSGFRPTTTESVEAFDMDVQLIERQFTSSFGDRSVDSLRQHFPFISLCWYRLSFACAFLDAADPSQRGGKALTWAIEWASQILVHLSSPPSSGAHGRNSASALAGQLEPDSSVVHIMSFAIDHYYVVIVYAAFFLVNSWLSNLTDRELVL